MEGYAVDQTIAHGEERLLLRGTRIVAQPEDF